MAVGEEGDYTYRNTVTTRMTLALKMGSDERHFNVSCIVRDYVTRVSTNYNLFEVAGEQERNRAKALLLTSLTPYR